MSLTITLETPIVETPRTAQLRGLFDLPAVLVAGGVVAGFQLLGGGQAGL